MSKLRIKTDRETKKSNINLHKNYTQVFKLIQKNVYSQGNI